MTTNQELRKLAEELRRKPIPLADIIPALQRAADRIDRLEAENEAKDRLVRQVWSFLENDEPGFAIDAITDHLKGKNHG